MSSKFKEGDRVVVVRPSDTQMRLLHRSFTISKIDTDEVAHGLLDDTQSTVGLYTFKLEHWDIFHSPLMKALR